MTVATPDTTTTTTTTTMDRVVAENGSDSDEDMERELFGLTAGAMAGAVVEAEEDEKQQQQERYARLERLMVEGAEVRRGRVHVHQGAYLVNQVLTHSHTTHLPSLCTHTYAGHGPR